MFDKVLQSNSPNTPLNLLSKRPLQSRVQFYCQIYHIIEFNSQKTYTKPTLQSSSPVASSHCFCQTYYPMQVAKRSPESSHRILLSYHPIALSNRIILMHHPVIRTILLYSPIDFSHRILLSYYLIKLCCRLIFLFILWCSAIALPYCISFACFPVVSCGRNILSHYFYSILDSYSPIIFSYRIIRSYSPIVFS